MEYIIRIDGFRNSDFTLCVENAKSLLESVAREVCSDRGIAFSPEDTFGKVLKLAFSSLGYGETTTIRQIAGALANVGQQMGNLRNELGATSHGRTLAQLEARKDVMSRVSSDFLLFSTELIACFMIELFETEFPRTIVEHTDVDYDENEDFNEHWDEMYGVFEMADYSFAASEILFGLDPQAYQTELNLYGANGYEDTD